MKASLIEELKKVRDFRTKQGQRHPLWLVLLLVIMGTMSGCCGYRSLGDFVGRHKQPLIDPTSRGMSGGAVLNSQGELIGIHGRAITEASEDDPKQTVIIGALKINPNYANVYNNRGIGSDLGDK
jgi:DDE_Tnp_1-associated